MKTATRLETETDPAILRRAASLLARQNELLASRVAELEEEIAKAKGSRPEDLQRRLELLEQQLEQMTKKVFGNSSERSEMPEGKGRSKSEEPKGQKGHGPTPQQLLEVPVPHKLDEADKVCPQCGHGLAEMAGQFEEHVEVDVISTRFILKRHQRQKYRCTCGGCVETAPGPDKLIDGGRYSVGFAVHVATAKYCDHLPLERQVRMMARDGLCVTSQTLWDQIEALAGILGPARPRLLEHIRSHAVVGADETRWKLLSPRAKGANKQWYVWLVHAPTAVYYAIDDSRSTDVIHTLLAGFSGTLVCDAYAAYGALARRSPGIVLAHCWAHVRRRFVELAASHPATCGEILTLINELFRLDASCPTGPPGDQARRTLRDESSRMVIRDIEAWVWRTMPSLLPQTAMHAAVGYMLGAWPGLVRFLDEPSIPLDNNASERAARGPVVGRKNHYGSKSRRGTQVAALFYTFIESAKLCGVEPRFYLREAARRSLRGEPVPLPHEVAAELASGALKPTDLDDGSEALVAAALHAAAAPPPQAAAPGAEHAAP